MKGRKSIPTSVKQLSGTLRPDRINPSEPVIEPLVELPVAPDWLNDWAKDEWYVVVGWLHSMNMLSQIDTSILAAYCQQMGVYREAEEQLQGGKRTTTTDKGYEMASPWVSIGSKALQMALKIAAEYGLTPSSRSRITWPAPKKAPSRLEELIQKRRS